MTDPLEFLCVWVVDLIEQFVAKQSVLGCRDFASGIEWNGADRGSEVASVVLVV